ncbi:MAG: hypothetical protein IT563_06680 [Alphaproteobacteria bacterium]|nr:hypothetical protein [Alphaproteobacteria bacterium]
MWLERLIGEKLSSVTFVMDYWQLNFDGHGFNVMSKITVRCDACTINSVQPGFRDLLCGQIAKTVRTAGWTKGTGVLITFTDGSSLQLSARPEDYNGPEAIYFHSGDDFWVE